MICNQEYLNFLAILKTNINSLSPGKYYIDQESRNMPIFLDLLLLMLTFLEFRTGQDSWPDPVQKPLLITMSAHSYVQI